MISRVLYYHKTGYTPMLALAKIVEWYTYAGLAEALIVILLSEPKTKWQWIRHIYIWGPVMLMNIVGKGKG